ncbi:MAG: S8 family peptidase [Elusimicrobiales bacterium]|nr:S8 family peptidase [Elusimicrobiales bacterium]HOL62123.1 S8 family peptidase [Elusimicrobiales bacterium]HPO94710.1 S8 family peptidase [Elusimicrobiales bacterium]
MKKIGLLIMALSFAFNLSAVQKIVMLNDNKDIKMSQSDIERLGGKIIKELPLINSVVADFPDYVKDNDVYTLGYVKKVENDLYIKWIEETTLPEIPSVEGVLKNIKENNYDYSIVSPSFSTPKASEEELKEMPWGIKRVNAYSAWDYTTGKNVKVAVIDTGIDYNHTDLASNYAGGYNAVNSSKPPLDDQGHGTHVAGTIAAVKDLKGVVGVAPNVKLYAVKVLDSNGSGQYSWIIDGIQWAVNNKMNVVNMSLGGPSGSDALKAAIDAAYKAGVVVVCAAGNDGGAVNYPAKYPGAIAVSALDSSDKIASFSSRGPEIAFIAPGVSVYSTYKGGVYKTLSGTSMASPHVAGLAALVVGLGVKNPDDVKNVLIKSAVKITGLKDTEQGNGVIDASKFYQILNSR